MLRQELLYTTQDTGLPMLPAAVRAGTTEAVRTSLRACCPSGEESTSQSNKLFSLQSLIFTPSLLTQHNYATLLPGIRDLSRVNFTFT